MVTGRAVLAAVVFCTAAAHAATTQPGPAASQPERALLPLDRVMPDLALPAAKLKADESLVAPAQTLLDEAARLAQQRRGVLAVVRLEKALGYAPNSRQIHRALGQVHVQTGNAAKAAIHLERALAYDPNDAEAWYLLGRSQRELGLDRQAVRSLMLAGKCTPPAGDSPAAVLLPYELGKLLGKQGYNAAALGLLEQVFKATDPKSLSPGQKAEPDIYALSGPSRSALAAEIARLKAVSGDADAAIADLEALVASGKADRKTQITLLLAYQERDKGGTKAVELLRRIVGQSKPDDADSLAGELVKGIDGQKLFQLCSEAVFGPADQPRRARADDAVLVLVGVNALDRAQKGHADIAAALGKFVEQAPQADPAVHVRLIRSLVDASDWTGGAKAVRRALESWPNQSGVIDAGETFFAKVKPAAGLAADWRAKTDFASIYVSGRLLAAGGDRQSALEQLANVCRLKPDFAEAYVARINLLLAANDPAAAMAVVKEADDAKVGSPRLHLSAGRAFLAVGQADQAIDRLRLAEQADRDNVQYGLELSDAYMAGGQSAAALRRLRRIYESHPNLPAVLVRLARINEELGQHDEAAIYAEKVLAVEPGNTEAARIRGWVMLLGGKPEGQRVLEKLARDNGDDPHALLGLALLKVRQRARLQGDDQAAADSDAVAALRKAIEAAPDMLPARKLLAELLYISGDLLGATDEYRLIHARQPRDEEMTRRLIQLLLVNLQAPSAEKLIKETAFSKEGVRRQLAVQLAEARELRGENDLAVEVLKSQLADEKDEQARGELRLSLAVSLARGEKFDQALEAAKDLQLGQARQGAVEAVRIECLTRLGRLDEADRIVADAAQSGGERADVLRRQLAVHVVNALSESGKHDDALTRLDELIEAEKDDGLKMSLQMVRLVTLRAAKREGDALSMLSAMEAKAVDREQKDRLQSMHLQLLMSLKKQAEFEKYFQAWLEDTPAIRHADLWYAYSNAWTAAGNPAEAKKALVKALELDPDHTSANNDLGYQLADEGVRLDEAEKMVRKALGGREQAVAYIDSLAWVHYKNGRFAEAAKLLGRAVLAERDPVILDHYGDVLYRLGRMDLALLQWKASARAYERDKDRPAGVDASNLESVRGKIAAAERDQPVPVAPLGKAPTTTQDD